MNKQISSQESSNIIFQIELDDSKRLANNLTFVLVDKEKEVQTLEQ